MESPWHGALRRFFPSRRVRSPAVAPDGLRIYAIGDMHGRADLLDALLCHIRADQGETEVRVVGLGDYVDRGRQSRETLDLLVDLGGDSRIGSEFLMGNHEEVLLAFLDEPGEGPLWCDFGGRETLASYGVAAPSDRSDMAGWIAARNAFATALPQSHYDLLRSLKTSTEAGGYFFAHAGVRPGVPLEEQSQRDLLWIREPFLRSNGALERVVVHGHTPAEAPHSDHRRVGVDTGAYLTGVLTAVRLEAEARTWIQASAGADGSISISERVA